jgi:hypothetical protein
VKRLSATVAVLALVLVAAAVLPGAATAGTTMHTKRLVMHQTAAHRVGKFTFTGTDLARSRRTGDVVGYDTISGTYFPKTQALLIHVAFSLKGGLIITRVKQLPGPPVNGFIHYKGQITKGSGKYAGVQGTITARSPAKNDKKTFVTLNYQL